MNYYSAFNLKIRSELLCPHLSIQPTEETDVTIERGEVPDCLPNNNPDDWYQYFEDKILFQHLPTGKFLIQNGNRILFDLPISENIKSSILPSYVFGALLRQRGYFVLHANAVVMNSKALLLMGPSGHGKSTLTYLLMKQGCSLFTDDVSVIDFSDSGIYVRPGSLYLKLTPDNVQRFKIKSQLQPVGFGSIKSCLKASAHSLTPALIHGIILLEIADEIPSYTADRIKGSECIKPLLDNIFLRGDLTELKFATQYFKKCAKIANQASILRLTRSEKSFSGHQITDFLFDHFFKNEKVLLNE